MVKPFGWLAVTGYPIQDVVAYDSITKNNATSDADGQLELSFFSADDQVFFEHIGYESLKLVVSKAQLSKQISLYPDTQRLGEIVLSVSRTKDEKKRVSKQVAILSDRDIASIVPNTSAELLREAPVFASNAHKVVVEALLFGDLKPIVSYWSSMECE